MHSRNASVGMTSSSGLQSSASSLSGDASNLVRALINFGQDEHGHATGHRSGQAAQTDNNPEHDQEHNSELDDETEEITVAGVKALSQDMRLKGKQRQQDNAEIGQLLQHTHLDSGKERHATESAKAPPKAIRSLLRSSQHAITLPPSTPSGQPIIRTLTSWKMADYAYKRDPCPFPTRARGLFTERIDPVRDEYRIVVRGYDKFFNVNEVSWTHVRSEV